MFGQNIQSKISGKIWLPKTQCNIYDILLFHTLLISILRLAATIIQCFYIFFTTVRDNELVLFTRCSYTRTRCYHTHTHRNLITVQRTVLLRPSRTVFHQTIRIIQKPAAAAVLLPLVSKGTQILIFGGEVAWWPEKSYVRKKRTVPPTIVAPPGPLSVKKSINGRHVP